MKTIARIILSAIFLGLTGLLMAIGASAPPIFFTYYRQWSQWILGILSTITGFLPFALWEILAVLLILWAIYTLIQNLRKLHIIPWLTGVLVIGSGLAFCFVAFWGLGHFAPPITEDLNLDVTEYSQEQLRDATLSYGAMASQLADQVERDDNGVYIPSDFYELANTASQGYKALEPTYPLLHATDAPVKKLTFGTFFSYTGTTGIFLCLTGESSVNPTSYPVSIPFTMCHELAHRLGVTAEDEANFVGFLAASHNPNPEFQYSAYYSAFLYTYNALYSANTDYAAQAWNSLSPLVQSDCRGATEHYKPYEGKVQEVTETLNDTYLKTFSHDDGVKSYGAVADPLIAWYIHQFS